MKQDLYEFLKGFSEKNKVSFIYIQSQLYIIHVINKYICIIFVIVLLMIPVNRSFVVVILKIFLANYKTENAGGWNLAKEFRQILVIKNNMHLT